MNTKGSESSLDDERLPTPTISQFSRQLLSENVSILKKIDSIIENTNSIINGSVYKSSYKTRTDNANSSDNLIKIIRRVLKHELEECDLDEYKLSGFFRELNEYTYGNKSTELLDHLQSQNKGETSSKKEIVLDNHSSEQAKIHDIESNKSKTACTVVGCSAIELNQIASTKRLNSNEQNTVLKKLRLSSPSQSKVINSSENIPKTNSLNPGYQIGDVELSKSILLDIDTNEILKAAKNIRRMERKDQKDFVIEMFMVTILFKHELGKINDLCNRLEKALEVNKEKNIQFSKEIEYLKKASNNLPASRVERFRNPVKTCKTIGIQVTPAIIRDGSVTITADTFSRLFTKREILNQVPASSNEMRHCIHRSTSTQEAILSDSNIQQVKEETSFSEQLLLAADVHSSLRQIKTKKQSTVMPIKNGNMDDVGSSDDDRNSSLMCSQTNTLPYHNTHPAPVPSIPQQRTDIMLLPPTPWLSVGYINERIVVTWGLNLTNKHQKISGYTIYGYGETSNLPSASLWKKEVEVAALQLPIAYILQERLDHCPRYHFIVQAEDNNNRLGPFSSPVTIEFSHE